MKIFAIVVSLLGVVLASARPLLAADLAIGTWTSRNYPGMTMTIEPSGVTGWKVTYHIKMDAKETLMVIESPLDGSEKDVMVDGKPSGETMAIKRVDERHTVTVVKLNSKAAGISKAEMSADGKMITVQNDAPPGSGNPAGKTTEIWERK